MMSESTTFSKASTTPNLSEIFEPPRTATKGCLGLFRKVERTSTSFCSRRPIAEGKVLEGPTIDACARCAAPNASSTYISMPLMRLATKAASFPSSPALKRRFSKSSTPGASSAKRAATGSIEYLSSTLPLGRPKWLAQTTVAPLSVSQLIVGNAALMRKSSVIVRLPEALVSIGTLKSVRTRTRLPETSPRSSSVGILMLILKLATSLLGNF